jgi:hypothetical protein
MFSYVAENSDIIARNEEIKEKLIIEDIYETIKSHSTGTSDLISLCENFHNSIIQNRRDKEANYTNQILYKNNERSGKIIEESNVLISIFIFFV